MNKQNKSNQHKDFKENSYEIEKETKGTMHLKNAPTPHIEGHQITEDME
ncbi:hypothetical protein [Metabacillus litoralis]|nr:hypothetical protein [Metabacillus litoralis]MCM3161433.1 hypothetical protein [Metabacillus litoralis]MCM3409283.1 hypothetical protein [Metabacillus litoralis]